jgi:hypothetical protein
MVERVSALVRSAASDTIHGASRLLDGAQRPRLQRLHSDLLSA